MNYICKYNSPVGEIELLSDGVYLKRLSIKGQTSVLDVIKDYEFEEELEVFDKTRKWLNEYFEGKEPKIKIPIKLDGTEFRQRVWKKLSEIPYGKTITYKEIADEIAKERNIEKMSSQAVGGAVGHNPISIIIPCHRVIGTDGSLTGYAGGIAIKEKLLRIEKII
ncbi:MAG: methylated-DNA--[protein]-cysteine S-methyltransferase [Clostridia bacterium]|nr:methylated-DNA--[protein]-cysteine S-methyltransferase [Clostridia bacterium]